MDSVCSVPAHVTRTLRVCTIVCGFVVRFLIVCDLERTRYHWSLILYGYVLCDQMSVSLHIICDAKYILTAHGILSALS